MSFYQDLFTYMQTQSGLTNLVDVRMYPLKLPQAAIVPALTYQKIARPRVYSHSGDSHLANPTYQFSCWAKTFEASVALAVQVEAAFTGFSGTMGSETVYAGFISNVIDDDIEPETALYRQIVDVEFWHKD